MKELPFEKSMEKLEKIVEELESGDIGLDQALKKYEEGIKLARMCQGKLDKAKQKIETLMKTEKGLFKTENLKEKED